MTKDYLDNNSFAAEVHKWIKVNKKEYNKRISQGLNPKDIKQPVVQIPENIVGGFIRLTNGIASKSNFRGYSYIEDMKHEAIIVCIKYAHNFNIEKSKNAFAYFSQFIFTSFLQYLNKEKKLRNTKFELVKDQLSNAEHFDYKNIVHSNSNDNNAYIDPENNLVFERTIGTRKARIQPKKTKKKKINE